MHHQVEKSLFPAPRSDKDTLRAGFVCSITLRRIFISKCLISYDSQASILMNIGHWISKILEIRGQVGRFILS